MGISINLYRVSKSERIEDITNLEEAIESSKENKVDLYKITQDLAVIFSNSIDPFEDTDAIPYKILYGNFTTASAGWRVIGGFMPASEVNTIIDWIKANGIDSWEGFSKLYDALSPEVKQELEDIGAADKDEFYRGYVKPLTGFYFAAQKENNSILFVGE